jgi:hypothetical protein
MAGEARVRTGAIGVKQVRAGLYAAPLTTPKSWMALIMVSRSSEQPSMGSSRLKPISLAEPAAAQPLLISRLAASLLQAIGAPKGITVALSEYVRTAVRLANDPAAYARYKSLFTDQVWNQTIGNVVEFTREYEQTCLRVVHEMHAITTVRPYAATV